MPTEDSYAPDVNVVAVQPIEQRHFRRMPRMLTKKLDTMV